MSDWTTDSLSSNLFWRFGHVFYIIITDRKILRSVAISDVYFYSSQYNSNESMNRWMLLVTNVHCKAILGWGHNGLMNNFCMKHAPGAGLIVGPVDLQSSVLSLCYGCPLIMTTTTMMISLRNIVADANNTNNEALLISYLCIARVLLHAMGVIIHV